MDQTPDTTQSGADPEAVDEHEVGAFSFLEAWKPKDSALPKLGPSPGDISIEHIKVESETIWRK